MNENKRYEKRMNFNVSLPDERCFKNEYCIVDEARDRYEALSINEIVDRLNEQDERIKELENKLNQTALEFLNHETISMGKAVEISEMSYYDFIKYRAEHGNPMELQL